MLFNTSDLTALVDNCVGTFHVPQLLVKLINAAEVSTVLQLANEFKITVYPISAGHNWGYGSRSPYTMNSVVLDLSLMNKIIDFNAATGVVTLEPGVTQQQLYQFLNDKKLPFLVPTTGAGPTASVLANALEHGFGLTPQADHCQAIMNLEAVLPDGTFYHSDFTAKGAIELDRNFKWAVGPYLDGIFTQSNLGVVTSMTIALSFKSSDISAFYFTLKSDAYLEKATLVIQDLMHRYGHLLGGINLMNALRVISMLKKSSSDKALTESELNLVQKELSLSDWTGVGTLYCEKEISKFVKKEIKKKLAPYCKQIIFMNRQRVRRIECLLKFIPKVLVGSIQKQLGKVKESLDIFEGKPGPAALPLTYWRSKYNIPLEASSINPDVGDIGLIWYAPVLVMTPDKVRSMVETVTQICRQNQIDPLITFTAFNPRIFDVTIPLLFNRLDLTQKRNAQRCYEQLITAGQSAGCLPYRLGVQGSSLTIEENNFWKLQRTLKQAVDPNNILAPGRYSL